MCKNIVEVYLIDVEECKNYLQLFYFHYHLVVILP